MCFYLNRMPNLSTSAHFVALLVARLEAMEELVNLEFPLNAFRLLLDSVQFNQMLHRQISLIKKK